MKAAKNEIAVIVLLSLLVVVSMVVNVYNGTTFYIMRSGESAPYDWNFLVGGPFLFAARYCCLRNRRPCIRKKRTVL